jgi:hypothetical protein
MKDEDEQPTEEELREAAELAKALEGAPADVAEAAQASPADALEAATLLRHARDPIVVPPALEPKVMAEVAEALEARRRRRPGRARTWIAISLVAPTIAAFVFSFTVLRSTGSAPPAPITSLPSPSADLLAAQSQATRGGGRASAALARLDLEMRAYRHRYHEDLRRRLEGAP